MGVISTLAIVNITLNVNQASVSITLVNLNAMLIIDMETILMDVTVKYMQNANQVYAQIINAIHYHLTSQLRTIHHRVLQEDLQLIQLFK